MLGIDDDVGGEPGLEEEGSEADDEEDKRRRLVERDSIRRAFR